MEGEEGPSNVQPNEPEEEHSEPPRPSMMASYSEISFSSKPLNEDGQVTYDGAMTHFIADDLEYKIKISSPVSEKRDACPSIDMTVLNDLEAESRKIAQSVDGLIENLSGILHSVSSITADNVQIYKDSVSKTCDAVDSNIKCMYTILAKGEEVFQAMGPVKAHAARISEIRRLLNLFESNM